MINREFKALSPAETIRFALNMKKSAPEAFRQLHLRHGRTVRVPIPKLSIISSTDPNFIHHILYDRIESYGKGRYGDFLEPLWGKATVQLSDNEDWKRQRRVCGSSFASGETKKYHEIILEDTALVFKRFEQACDEKLEIPLYFEFRSLLMKILCDSWFGNLTDPEIGRISELLRLCTDLAWKRLAAFPKRPIWLPLPDNLKYQKLAAQIHEIVDAMIERVRNGGEAKMLLQQIVLSIDNDSRKSMSYIEARNNLVMFLIAAYEFPSLGWTLFYLGKNREIRERVLNEIDTILQGRAPQSEDLPKFVFLTNCINEALRLEPPAPIMARLALENDNIGGIPVKKGTNVVIPVLALHYDPQIWTNPFEYNPDRFNSAPPKHSFLPFGTGPRGCTGEDLTRQLKMTVLIQFFQHFEYGLPDEYQPEPHDKLKLFPKGGVPVKLHRRT